MKIIRFLLVSFLVFVVITVAAFVYLKWWQAMLVMAALIAGIVLGVKLIIRSFGNMLGKAMIQAFEVKAAVMKGATAEVHSVVAVAAPPPKPVEEDDEPTDEDYEDEEGDDDDDDDEPEAPRDLAWYRIDATIVPGPSQGPMHYWDVGDLVVVDYGAKPLNLNPLGGDADDPGEGYHFEDVQVLEDAAPASGAGARHEAEDDEGEKYAGPRRLNVLVGVPRELRRLKFRYYTEQFGRIELPPPLAPQLVG